jgi:hypothetical protein
MRQVRAPPQPVTDSHGSCVNRYPYQGTYILTDHRVDGTHGTASICFSDDKKLSIDEDLCSMLSAGSPFFALQLKQRDVVIALPQ